MNDDLEAFTTGAYLALRAAVELEPLSEKAKEVINLLLDEAPEEVKQAGDAKFLLVKMFMGGTND